MKEFLEYVVLRLVRHPELARFYDSTDEKTFRFRLELETEDVGLVVGRGGHTITAIRTLLAAAAARKGMNIFVDVVERMPDEDEIPVTKD